MKKLFASLSILLLVLFLIPSKAYAYYENSDTQNIIDTYSWSLEDTYTYTIFGNSELVNVYEIDADFNNSVSPRHITLFFDDVVSESYAYYIGFSSVSATPEIFYEVSSDDGAKIDFNLFSYYLPIGQELALHIVHDTYFDYQAVMPNFFNALLFYKGPVGQFAQYIINDSYVNGYNDGVYSMEDDLITQYQAGYSAGLVAEEEAQLSIVNFVPRILGSVWNFIYVIGTFEFPFLNISVIDLFLLLGGIGLIVVLIKLLL